MSKVARVLAVQCGLIAMIFGVSIGMAAQEGKNAIYYDSLGDQAPSPAYIDAAPFYYAMSTPDICVTIYSIVSSSTYPLAGAVIDARGIYPNQGRNAGTDGTECGDRRGWHHCFLPT
jgi:hypothetical protein